MKRKVLFFAIASFAAFFALIYFVGKEPLIPLAVITTAFLVISNFASSHAFKGLSWGVFSFLSIGLLYFLDTQWQSSIDNELFLFLGWLPWSVGALMLLLTASFTWIFTN